MEPAATWKKYAEVLDRMHDDEVQPNFKLFNNILSRVGLPECSAAQPGGGSGASGAAHRPPPLEGALFRAGAPPRATVAMGAYVGSRADVAGSLRRGQQPARALPRPSELPGAVRTRTGAEPAPPVALHASLACGATSGAAGFADAAHVTAQPSAAGRLGLPMRAECRPPQPRPMSPRSRYHLLLEGVDANRSLLRSGEHGGACDAHAKGGAARVGCVARWGEQQLLALRDKRDRANGVDPRMKSRVASREHASSRSSSSSEGGRSDHDGDGTVGVGAGECGSGGAGSSKSVGSGLGMEGASGGAQAFSRGDHMPVVISATSNCGRAGRGRGLTAVDRSMQDIVKALDLMDRFTEGTAIRPKAKGRLQEAEEALQQIADEGVSSSAPQPPRGGLRHRGIRAAALVEALRPLPMPPPDFPASPAWEYLLASSVRTGGTEALDSALASLRVRMRVLLLQDGGGDAALQFGTTAVAAVHTGVAAAGANSMHTSADNMRTEADNMRTEADNMRTEAGNMRSFGGAHAPSGPGMGVLGSAGRARGFERAAGAASTRSCDGSSEPSPARLQPPPLRLSPPVPSGLSEEGEMLWQWLSTLLAGAHESEAARLEVRRDLEAAPQPWAPSNPHCTPCDRHVEAVERLVGIVSTLKDADDLQHLLEQTATRPSVDANTLRAAAVGSLDPQSVQSAIYFLIHLSKSISSGTVPGGDAGFLLVASLNLLLSEVQWLLALLRVHEGASSPHLRALHAALKAYEANADYAAKLCSRAEAMQAAVASALARAEAAEQLCADAQDAAEHLEARAEGLQQRNDALELEVQQLRMQVFELSAVAKGPPAFPINSTLQEKAGQLTENNIAK